jgi:hypothetical protein
MTSEDPRIALRPFPTDAARLDDVFVKDVDMFRAEMLDDNNLWIACYLLGTGVDGDRIAFHVRVHEGGLHLEVVERPGGSVTFE